MNTSGFKSGSRELWRHRSKGFIRLNAKEAIISKSGAEILQSKFETLGVERFKDSNRLLLAKRVPGNTPVDAYIVTIKSDREGHINFDAKDWRTLGVRVIASSAHNEKQEVILLIPVGGKIQTTLGEWEVVCRKNMSLLELVS